MKKDRNTVKIIYCAKILKKRNIKSEEKRDKNEKTKKLKNGHK